MAAYFIGQLTVTDRELMGQYVEAVGPMLGRFGCEVLMRGIVHRVAEGDLPHQMAVVVRFADLDALNKWYESEEYKAIAGMRHDAAESTLTIYDEMPD